MRLGELLRGLAGAEMGRDAGPEISSLAYDSRRVQPGTLFFAIQGEKADGHQFIPQALKSGAVAVVSERAAPAELAARWVRVPKIRRALAEAAWTFYGHPDSHLQLIGITGTNGKTTPESLDLLSDFTQSVKEGARAAVMEVSSHALAQERVWGFRFSAAVFTNLTQIGRAS